MRPAIINVVAILTIASHGAWAQNTYPPYVTKKVLYAQNDLRGKKAPKLYVQKWLTGKAPATVSKVLLIDFWSTWCGPCVALIADLNSLQKTFKNDLVVIGISDEAPDTVKEFMRTHQMDYNVAVDQSNKMRKRLVLTGIPHVLIVTPDNIVRWQGFPQIEEDRLTEQKVAQIIAASKTTSKK